MSLRGGRSSRRHLRRTPVQVSNLQHGQEIASGRENMRNNNALATTYYFRFVFLTVLPVAVFFVIFFVFAFIATTAVFFGFPFTAFCLLITAFFPLLTV